MKTFKRYLCRLLAILVSGLSLWLAFRQACIPEVVGAFRQANVWILLLVPFPLFLSIWCRLERWRWLLTRQGSKESRRPLMAAMLVGYLGSTVLPVRMGELARIYVSYSLAGVNPARNLSSIVLEKVLHVGALVLALVVLLFFASAIPWAQQVLWVSSALLLGMVLVVAGLLMWGRQLIHLFRKVRTRLPSRIAASGLWQWSETFIASITVLKSMRTVALVVGWSLAAWTFAVVMNALVLFAFAAQPAVSAAFLATLIVNLGATLPSAPGQLGVFHYLFALSLKAFGIAPGTALSCAFAAHGLTYGCFTIAGTIALGATGLRASVLRRPEVPQATRAMTSSPDA